MTDYESILISAVRYALGRRTYIVKLTVNYVLSELDKLSENCKKVIKKDIVEQSRLGLGDECDKYDWNRLLSALSDTEPCVNSNEITQELNEKSNKRNGDCETCKHINSTSQICEKCDGESKYEPYIPNNWLQQMTDEEIVE